MRTRARTSSRANSKHTHTHTHTSTHTNTNAHTHTHTQTHTKVTVEDAAGADRMFSVLMGDSVAPRKEFISTHAQSMQLGDTDV